LTLAKQQIMSLAQSNRLDEAKALCEQACQSNPNDTEAWFLLGAINGQLGDFSKAEESSRRVIALGPTIPAGHYNLGIALLKQDKFDDAIASFQQAIKLSPGFFTAYHDLGNAQLAKGLTEEAIESYKRALRTNPDFAEAHVNLGNTLVAQGKPSDAEPHFQRAVELKPTLAEAHLGLGDALNSLSRPMEAIACYQQAIRYKPDNAEAHFNLGKILYDIEASACREHGWPRINKYQEAASHFRRVLAINPDHYDACYNLGLTLLECNMLEESSSHIRKTISLKPDVADTHFLLGTVFQAAGKYEEAIESYRQALQLDPTLTKAQYALVALGAAPAPDKTPANHVATHFDEFSETFDKKLVEQLGYRAHEQLNQIVRRFIDTQTPALDILDLGCGTGLCGVLLHDMARTLTGVDLSPKMLDKARKKNVYDKLVLDDVMIPLTAAPSAYDLIVATDVFIYIGDLAPVFVAAGSALKPGGLLAFSIETAKEDVTYVLRTTGRYAQSMRYIRALSQANGLEELCADAVILRKEKGQPVAGHVFVLRKPTAAAGHV
jgi:predicted TPR repeat methyltransferase